MTGAKLLSTRAMCLPTPWPGKDLIPTKRSDSISLWQPSLGGEVATRSAWQPSIKPVREGQPPRSPGVLTRPCMQQRSPRGDKEDRGGVRWGAGGEAQAGGGVGGDEVEGYYKAASPRGISVHEGWTSPLYYTQTRHKSPVLPGCLPCCPLPFLHPAWLPYRPAFFPLTSAALTLSFASPRTMSLQIQS